MKSKSSHIVEDSYRAIYGKLFSALLKSFGTSYVTQIEDAIQNAFYKALKSWKPNRYPDHKENWLFMVARNDLLNQIKRQQYPLPSTNSIEIEQEEGILGDLRLKTLLFLSKSTQVSAKAKVVFMLKNIFGLHVKEIASATLIGQEAIYKSLNRAKKKYTIETSGDVFEKELAEVTPEDITLVEEILYAVFNIGFDSFSEQQQSIVNEDLCLEAFALANMLANQYQQPSSQNLLSLFCFHLARIPEKVKGGKFIPFFEQDKTNWNADLLQLGFHYMHKPTHLNRYYLESLITSKHMMAETYDAQHWEEIIQLYELMLPFSDSPIVKLNLCYCLSQVNRTAEALELLSRIENQLPIGYLYFSLVKAKILKEQPAEFQQLMEEALKNIKQEIRREYIFEHLLSDL